MGKGNHSKDNELLDRRVWVGRCLFLLWVYPFLGDSLCFFPVPGEKIHGCASRPHSTVGLVIDPIPKTFHTVSSQTVTPVVPSFRRCLGRVPRGSSHTFVSEVQVEPIWAGGRCLAWCEVSSGGDKIRQSGSTRLFPFAFRSTIKRNGSNQIPGSVL